MSIISVTGATGFIGRHLLRRLAQRRGVTIRGLAHSIADDALPPLPSVQWVRGDLRDRETAGTLLVPGGDLIHLAFPERWTTEQQLAANANLAERVVAVGVRRVLYCSTAVVAGRTQEPRVNEETPPEPITGYEATKLQIEQIWREHCGERVELVIIRPTAVFGAGGRNLVKLATAVSSGNAVVNYLRSCLFGRRRMNLVPVATVVSTCEFLLDFPGPLRAEVFIVSADDDPLNNFRDIERLLRAALNIPDYAVPPLFAPQGLLAAALRLAGRSNWNPGRIYEAKKLERAGYAGPSTTLEDALRDFAAWFASARNRQNAEAA